MSQSAAASTGATSEVETKEQEEDYDIPEEVETVIGKFLPPINLKCLSLQKNNNKIKKNLICMLFYRTSAVGTER